MTIGPDVRRGASSGLAGLVGAIVRWDPTERATDADMLTRWPSGRRAVVSPALVVCLVIAAGALAFAPTAAAVEPDVGAVAGLAASVLAFLVLGWFAPIAQIERRRIEDVGLGTFVVAMPGWGMHSVSPVMGAAETDLGAGEDLHVATKDGAAYGRARNRTLPVVRLLDPFRRLRREPVDAELPPLVRWVYPLITAVDENQSYEGRTHNLSADRGAVDAALRSAGLPDDILVDELVAFARRFGVLDRTGTTRRRLRISQAGRLWAAVVRRLAEQSTPVEAVPVGEELQTELRELADETLAGSRYRSPTMTPDRFAEWVGALVENFRKAVETTAAYETLWTRAGQPQDERAVQGLAQAVFRSYCEAADVDMSKETDAGDGPVDFKFSQGWSSRALIEFKLLSSSRLAHGAAVQLPAYLDAEAVSCGFYVCVGFSDADLAESRRERVVAECADLSRRTGYTVAPVFVDARRRASASRR